MLINFLFNQILLITKARDTCESDSVEDVTIGLV